MLIREFKKIGIGYGMAKASKPVVFLYAYPIGYVIIIIIYFIFIAQVFKVSRTPSLKVCLNIDYRKTIERCL